MGAADSRCLRWSRASSSRSLEKSSGVEVVNCSGLPRGTSGRPVLPVCWPQSRPLRGRRARGVCDPVDPVLCPCPRRDLLLRPAQLQEERLHRPAAVHADQPGHAPGPGPAPHQDEGQHVSDLLVQQRALPLPDQCLLAPAARWGPAGALGHPGVGKPPVLGHVSAPVGEGQGGRSHRGLRAAVPGLVRLGGKPRQRQDLRVPWLVCGRCEWPCPSGMSCITRPLGFSEESSLMGGEIPTVLSLRCLH